MQFNMILPNKYYNCLNIAILVFACSCLQISHTTKLRPAEHLVPPPPPPYALPLKHVKEQTAGQYAPDNNSGIMTRLARWFGFGQNGAQEQQLAPTEKGKEIVNQAETRHSYNYVSPNKPYNDNSRPCSLCNKYPWVPIFPISAVFRPQQQSNQWWQVHQQPEAQASQNYAFKKPYPGNLTLQQQIPHKQRAVQFDYLAPQKNSYTPYIWPTQSKVTQDVLSTQTQQKNYFETTTASYGQFHENVGAQSELQVNGIVATQVSKDPNFEIIKSQQLTDYVSSVEYPATFVQAQAIDLLLANQKQTTSTEPTNTVKYQGDFFDPNLSRHIPASEILTNPNSFGGFLNLSVAEPNSNNYGGFLNHSTAESTTVVPETNEELAATTNAPPFSAESLVISNFHSQPEYSIVETTVGDNFPSASSQNFTHFQHNDNNLELWVTPSNEFFKTTTTSETTTLQPLDDFYEVIPSTNTNHIQQSQRLSNSQRERETPKRLLNAPIQYVNAGEKASTRDPSVLNYRLGAAINKKPQEFHYFNHAYPETELTTPSAPATSLGKTEISATSAYGAIDASGQFAGISPPAPQAKQAATKIIQQVIVPYSIKSLPRPFEPTNADSDLSSTVNRHWAVDAYGEQQKKSDKTTNSRRNNKYFTKILASNLRELLHREREHKRKTEAFDIAKLRKNIDNWTQQQFTSQSHRSSTPTLRGRSKHIPAEYLTTTTPSPIKPKTTKLLENSDLSTSINNLEQRRGSKRFEYVPIDDNRLLDLEPNLINHSFATTTTERTTTVRLLNKTTTPISPTVIASSAPKIHLNENRTKELWQKTRVYISPETNEKVYVVTPVPRFFPQRKYLTTPEVQTETTKPMYKPRFVVRPTPGSSSLEASSAEYRANLFGLTGLSAYVPVAPVEIIDGNSKVVTVVTPSSDRTKAKTTMQPSPR